MYTEWILTLFHIFKLIPSYAMTIKLVSLFLLLNLLSIATLYLTKMYVYKRFSYFDSFLINFYFHGFGIITFLIEMIGCEAISNSKYVVADPKMKCYTLHHIIQFVVIAIPLLMFIILKFIKKLNLSKK